MATSNIRIPPDSTGKRLPHRVQLELKYNNGTIDFAQGDRIICVTSGVTGDVWSVDGNTASGTIHVLLTESSSETVVAGENIQVDGVTNATVNGTDHTKYYYPVAMIAGGGINPDVIDVDRYGAVSTTFYEGSPKFDSFGRMQVSQYYVLAEYEFKYQLDQSQFTITNAVSGTATYDSVTPAMLLQSLTASGSNTRVTTNKALIHQPGISQLAMMGLYVGDTGKANVVRRWGIYDKWDGFYFELDGTTLYVVVRSYTTGTITETRIPQSQWNSDRVDGSKDYRNKSDINLDVSKTNLYWIDYQWVGIGKVRFGISVNGIRIVCHEYKAANNIIGALLAQSNLPLRWEQKNTGITASTSQMRVIAGIIGTEGLWRPTSKTFSQVSELRSISSSASWVPLVSVRPKDNFNGKFNKGQLIIEEMAIYTSAEPIEIAYAFRPDIGPSTNWVSVSDSSLTESETTATSASDEQISYRGLASSSDVKTFNLGELFGENDTSSQLYNLAELSPFFKPYVTIMARTITNNPTNVKATLRWREII